MASTAFAILILVGVAAFALKVAGPRDWKNRRGASDGDAGGWVDSDCGDGGGDGGGD